MRQRRDACILGESNGVTTERILVGHFLIRTNAARRAGVPSAELVHRPDLLRVGGTWLEEVYFEFQFDRVGIRSGLGAVVKDLKRYFDDLTIADWLARPNPVLSGATPLRWVATGRDDEMLAKAAAKAGPLADSRIQSQTTALSDS